MIKKKTKAEIRAQYKRRLESNSAYNKENYKTFSFRLNVESEKDMIDWLNGISDKKAYFTRLIILDQKRAARRQKKERKENA